MYACVEWEGLREGMYQNARLRIHREEGQKFLTFCVRNSHYKESYKETRKTFETFVFELII